jgi:hypothetical protein
MSDPGAAPPEPIHILTGIWDNVDILDDWLAHCRSVGISGVFAMDFGSTDGSLDVLASPRWDGFVVPVPFSGMTSNIYVTLLEHVRALGVPGWALVIDPDEFLCAPTISLAGSDLSDAMADADVITVPRMHMSCLRSEAAGAAPGHPTAAELTLRYRERDQGKVLIRIASDAMVAVAGHQAEGGRQAELAETGTCLLHAPIRSFEKFDEKIAHASGWLAANPQLPDWYAAHWRRWIGIRDAGGLHAEYLELFPTDAQVAVDGVGGEYVPDGRLAGLLDRVHGS